MTLLLSILRAILGAIGLAGWLKDESVKASATSQGAANQASQETAVASQTSSAEAQAAVDAPTTSVELEDRLDKGTF